MSERTEIWVFPGGANLHQAKWNGKQTQEGYEALFAPLG